MSGEASVLRNSSVHALVPEAKGGSFSGASAPFLGASPPGNVSSGPCARKNYDPIPWNRFRFPHQGATLDFETPLPLPGTGCLEFMQPSPEFESGRVGHCLSPELDEPGTQPGVEMRLDTDENPDLVCTVDFSEQQCLLPLRSSSSSNNRDRSSSSSYPQASKQLLSSFRSASCDAVFSDARWLARFKKPGQTTKKTHSRTEGGHSASSCQLVR